MAPQTLIRPQVIILKEGVDTSQGKPALLANITACLAVCEILKSTLGPMGMDKLIVRTDEDGKPLHNTPALITNDGATILKQLEIIHPAAKALVEMSRAQDAEVGDGTTTVTVLAGELLKQAKGLLEDGLPPKVIVKGFQAACQEALNRLRAISICKSQRESDGSDLRTMLEHCAKTSMNSKLIATHKDLFSKLVVDAVQLTNEESKDEEESSNMGSLSISSSSVNDLDDRFIGIKKVAGGSMDQSFLMHGVAFQQTFTYAGHEQQPKLITDPLIACLNVELELKAERDNAEIRVTKVQDYQATIDAEWQCIFRQLEALHQAGATVVLSRLPIGDLATQWFADRGIFSAGRVLKADLERVAKVSGARILSTLTEVDPGSLGTRCSKYEEIQLGKERYNMFHSSARGACTLVIRGTGDQFMDEVHRSLHDAIMVTRRTLATISSHGILPGGGCVEMHLAQHLRAWSMAIDGRGQLVGQAFARAFECIPRLLAENAGLDAMDTLSRLRRAHVQQPVPKAWLGLQLAEDESIAQENFEESVIVDVLEANILEPALIKSNAIASATEAACMILSVDMTIDLSQIHKPQRDFSKMAYDAGIRQ